MDRKKPTIITIASIKGGVGKSTSSIILSTLLSQKYKVLLIDMDTQASTTSYYFNAIVEQNKFNIVSKNIYRVLKGTLNINKAIATIDKNLDLIPSYLSLHLFNKEAINFKELKLNEALNFLDIKYDYVILDTNPSLDFTLTNALVVSNSILIPMTAEKWAVESLQILEFYIRELKLKIPTFIFITKFKRNNSHKFLLENLQLKKNFLGFISEREDLNKKIAENNIFDFKRDYMKEYQSLLDLLLEKTEFKNEI
ncbi:ParA family protein (plasmid) [Borrelia coriaceae]|uniref:ATPase, para family protein n=1 Tax=Borrelia coriaceae ATCC 43381 TaxID=1408429 RepID=W5SXK2_9SPIR|nr:ParA family protein [Borrelia coriaceae]AHH11640.1 ATPase, para family protein [Borrelia coriaceae ATCC 43381]UPA17134.1 ParA family protein [Borrelia coriaceae]